MNAPVVPSKAFGWSSYLSNWWWVSWKRSITSVSLTQSSSLSLGALYFSSPEVTSKTFATKIKQNTQYYTCISTYFEDLCSDWADKAKNC